LRVRPYIWYAERTKMRDDAVDRSFCDAIKINAITNSLQTSISSLPSLNYRTEKIGLLRGRQETTWPLIPIYLRPLMPLWT
jgi:hypothetical protein